MFRHSHKGAVLVDTSDSLPLPGAYPKIVYLSCMGSFSKASFSSPLAVPEPGMSFRTERIGVGAFDTVRWKASGLA